MIEHDALQLTQHQENTLRRLARRLLDFADKDQNRRINGNKSTLTREERFGTFALFGARGAGKTTMVDALESVLREESRPEGRKLTTPHICRPALDCTAVPRDIHFGISLCNYLAERLEGLEAGARTKRSCEGKVLSGPGDLVREELMPKFLPLDAEYRKLKLDLAVTSSEYQQIAQKELTARQGIQKTVQQTLEKILPRDVSVDGQSSRAISHLLVVLEDADLSVGRLNAELLSVFLADLSDSRLMFLIVADAEHLEQRLVSETRGPTSSKVTAHRLLDKLVPVSHRFYVEPWGPNAMWRFIPPGAEAEDLNEDSEEEKEDKTLNGLFRKVMPIRQEAGQVDKPTALRKPDIARLIPTHPRGLMDLYRQLKRHLDEARDPLSAKELLVILAHCRGEHTLARRINSRSLDWRAARLQWAKKESERARWSRIVHEARSNESIWALEPDSLFREAERGTDDALWAEVLLDLGFRQDYGQLKALFVDRFEPLREKIASCGLEFRRESSSFVHALWEKPALLNSPWLSFVAEEEGAIRIEAGWSGPMLCDPDIRLRELLHSLTRLPMHKVDVQKIGPFKIAPRSVRNLILLVDRVNRLPWAELQERAEIDEQWQKIIPIFDLLCADAYRATLDECLQLEARAAGDEPPVGFHLEIDTSLEVEHLFDEDEEKLAARVRKMQESLSAPMPKEYRDHPMAIAMKHFFAEVVGR